MLRIFSVTLFAVLSTSVSNAQDINCSDMGNLPQQPMNMCAALMFEKADRALNIAWSMVRERNVGRSGDSDPVLKAQRAWIDYRKYHCEAQGNAFEGGTLQPFIVASCKTDITRDRTQELLLMIETR